MLARMLTAATVTVAAAGAGGERAAREFTGPGMKSNLFRRVQPHGEPGLGRLLLNEKSGDGSGDGSMGVSWNLLEALIGSGTGSGKRVEWRSLDAGAVSGDKGRRGDGPEWARAHAVIAPDPPRACREATLRRERCREWVQGAAQGLHPPDGRTALAGENWGRVECVACVSQGLTGRRLAWISCRRLTKGCGGLAKWGPSCCSGARLRWSADPKPSASHSSHSSTPSQRSATLPRTSITENLRYLR